MAVIYKNIPEEREQLKFSFFFKIGMVFLLLGIVLRIFHLTFWGELSTFVCCAVIVAGIQYVILHHIMYLTGMKIERVISVLFYTGISCLVLKFLSSLIFKEAYYVDISPCMQIHDIILFCLSIGVFLLPISVALLILKFGRIAKLFS